MFPILFTLLIALILVGLIKSTESLLAVRQERRDRGDDPNIYL